MSSFHWGRTITSYNLSQITYPDIHYLLHKVDDNGDLLYAFAKAYPEKVTYKEERIEKRYQQWLRALSRETWQSKTLLGLLNQNLQNNAITHTDQASN